MESPRRAVIRISQRGREALAGTDRIDSRYLRRFPEFLEFIRGGEGDEGGEKPPTPAPTPPETTPEELIETGYRQVQNALAARGESHSSHAGVHDSGRRAQAKLKP